MMILPSEMIAKIKAMPEEEKKALAKKLDEWTLKHIEDCQNLIFSEDGIAMSYLTPRNTYMQMDDVFLYYYLLDLPLYAVKEKSRYAAYEIHVRSYESNGKPFTILCLATEAEFKEKYADIVTKVEKPEDEE